MLRNFIRPFKGIHKKNLAGYIALCECRRNLKRISPAFSAQLVAVHSFCTCAIIEGWPILFEHTV